MYLEPRISNYDLHTTAVTECASRSPLAELLQRDLEERYALTVRRFALAKSTAELGVLWREALAGEDLPASLWAAWTHPRCDDTLEREIFGKVHMLQHQLGCAARQDHAKLRQLADALGSMREEKDGLILAQQRIQQTAETNQRELRAALSESQNEIVRLRALAEERGKELARWRETSTEPDLDWRGRAQAAEELLRQSRRRQVALEKENAALCQLVEERSGPRPAECDSAARPANPEVLPQLTGKAVLCVGGRSGQVEAYRAVVERCGGRFLHHDGGLEENAHRIDANLAAADVVICQAGCISHGAYWRVKDWCKRRGTPCLFAKSPGVTAFSRCLATMAGESAESSG
ncbi:hypothetical protein BURK2_01994 [Burkholderiales bacterium]|nr:hypothetical protein BURK2_01994 [Burkholderiales bacterium]